MKQLIYLTLLLLANFSYAQQKHNMTLQQCLEYAYTNSATVQKSMLDEQIAKAKVNETIGIGLPQINGSASLSYNFELRGIPFPPGFFLPDSLRNTIPPDAELAMVRSPFSAAYEGNLGLSINQIIFNGSYLVGLQASKTYTQLAKRNTETSKISTAENVTKAYFSLLVAKERITLLDNNLSRLDSLLKDVRALNKQGFAENLDLNRLEVTANNLRSEKNKVERLIQLSNELLKFQMGMPAQDQLEVTGSIRDFQLEQIPEQNVKADYKSRIEYNTLETGIALSELAKKNVRSGYLPSLVAFGQMGYSTGARYFASIGDFKNRWLGYGTVGLQLNVPIFDGLQKKYKVQQSNLELLKLEQDKKNLEKVIDFQTNQSQITLRNAIESLEIQKRNMELAKEVVRVSQIKYKQGVGTSSDIVNAESAFKEAETNYYASLYDALIAKVDLDKALGKLVKN
ncbi:MAG: TolC family protein [Raineya sp.]|jgi:outer membrane protein TolC|nr:TolC family protein [Raineya sp.]